MSDINYTQKLKYELDLRNKPFGILASSESFLRIVLLFLVVVVKKKIPLGATLIDFLRLLKIKLLFNIFLRVFLVTCCSFFL